MRNLALYLLMLFLFSPTLPAHGQMLADTLFTWQGYSSKPGKCGLKLYKNLDKVAKNYTVVLKELGENPGPSTIHEIGYLAEQIGRSFDIDPTQAYWVIHWGAFSYEGAKQSKKVLFIRATFSRTSTQRISAPQWRVISREDVEKYTDRQFLW